ncbi:hypothetical protein QT397_19775 [Microbulbifer sp. MKSA007]|nr:hypothetical protein QT397_19775 [Microbulbifer sp. MKSA007]
MQIENAKRYARHENLFFLITFYLFGVEVQPETFVVEQIANTGVKISWRDCSVRIDALLGLHDRLKSIQGDIDVSDMWALYLSIIKKGVSF